MAYSIYEHALGFLGGFLIGKSVGLNDSLTARVAILPGIMGFSIPSILITGVAAVAVSKQEAESQPPPVPQKVVLPDLTFNAANITAGRTALENLGLTVLETPAPEPFYLPSNIVTAESPPAGKTVDVGSEVELTVSTGTGMPGAVELAKSVSRSSRRSKKS